MDLPVKVIVHKAREGGFWAEVPAMPGCCTQGETRAELEANLREAIAGWWGAANDRSAERDEDDACAPEAITL